MKPQLHLFKNADFQPDHVCFVYNDSKILMIDNRLPTSGELSLSLSPSEPVFRLQQGWAISGKDFAKNPPTNKAEFRALREAFDILAAPVARDASIGAQYINWSVMNCHCGRCGSSLQPSDKELAKVCLKCEHSYYPQLTPAVIVLVKRGREILLARGLAPRTFYSCLAGFVEPGETLEEAIRREVKEEVGIEVKNIRYFGSQPWPFPNNMMVAFTADWVTGEISINREELSDAGWYNKERLPELVPSKASIARQMIDSALRN